MQRRAVTTKTPPGLALAFGFVVLVGYIALLTFVMQHGSYDQWGGLLVAPVLVALSVPIFVRESRRSHDPRLSRLLTWALVLKLLASLAREYVAFGLYGGVADASDYHNWGVKLSALFRTGDFHFVLSQSSSGTNFVRVLTGVVYTIIGPSKFGGYLFFSWLGFWGLYCFYRAFVVAVPEGRVRSYALILFFLPSMLFWPSGIGKEAWMLFVLGVAALGIAHLLSGSLVRGGVLAALGLWGAFVVRPHMAGLMAVALLGALIIRPVSRDLGPLVPVAKVMGLCVAGVLAFLLVSRTDQFLKETGIDINGGPTSTFQQLSDRTAGGGSGFTPTMLNSPLHAPLGVLTVIYRPLIFEANDFQALLAAIEGTFLLGLTIVRLPWLLAAVKSARRQPYVAFALIYSGLFVVVYSGFANFGLLVRERSQLYPLFFVLLAVPSRVSKSRETERERVTEPALKVGV